MQDQTYDGTEDGGLEILDLDPGQDREALAVVGDAAPSFTLAFMRSLRDCVELVNPAGRLTFMNENGRALMGIEGFDRVRGTVWVDLWPEESRPLADDALRRALAGEAVRMTAARRAAGGALRVWDVTVSPVVNAAGEVETILSLSREIMTGAAA